MSDPVTATVLTGDVAWWLTLLRAVLDAFKPALDLLIPGVIAYAAHRYIGNKAMADAVTTGAGVAYNHLSAAYARNGHVDFAAAKTAAVDAGVIAATEVAKRRIEALGELGAARQIDGALGALLSRDPTFSPVGTIAPGVVVNSPGGPGVVMNGVEVSLSAALPDEEARAIGDAPAPGAAR